MLNLGAINGPTRRSIITLGACAALGLSWRHMARGLYTPLGTAKRVVLLWLWGGPSQLDTFDPKPLAPEAIRGPFGTIQTRITGIRYSELFPRLAERKRNMGNQLPSGTINSLWFAPCAPIPTTMVWQAPLG